MIWVFDSGMWGLVTLWYLQEELPDHSFLYLWDTKNLPYGEKSPEFLHDRTFQCLHWMFDQWCELIILACNSASAYAIRAWQEAYPLKKVLSVTVPWVEAIVEWAFSRPLLLWTNATINSGIYPSVLQRLFPEYKVEFVNVVGEWWVDIIESQSTDRSKALPRVADLWNLLNFDSVILWCTHYPLIQDQIKDIVWEDIPIIDPSLESAMKISNYIDKHSELGIHIWIWTMRYCVTGEWEQYNGLQVESVII